MRHHQFTPWAFGLLLAALGSACLAKEPATVRLALPEQPYAYSQTNFPAHVAEVAPHYDNTPAQNPITDHGATLGRVLFYDKSLSVNATTSCGTCHLQKFAFTDNRPRSVGFNGGEVSRNSMSLVNLRFYRRGRFFWDERADTLESQVLMPIENPIEMGHRLEDLIPQLQANAIYPPQFAAAFGDPTVTRERVAQSLAQFIRSIVSFGSRYDEGRSQVASVHEPFPNFTQQENHGKEQFFGQARCVQRHLPDNQSAFFQLSQPTVNGIDSSGSAVDAGVGIHSAHQKDMGKFKASSLRNVELTAPYMHDGRFKTLDAVIEHYNWSVRPHENLDPILADFVSGLALPEVEKVALTAFLLTLTDHQLINDPKFADPFEVARTE
jgi:cytochrome c peroxidase